jgi:hypothetical protein
MHQAAKAPTLATQHSCKPPHHTPRHVARVQALRNPPPQLVGSGQDLLLDDIDDIVGREASVGVPQAASFQPPVLSSNMPMNMFRSSPKPTASLSHFQAKLPPVGCNTFGGATLVRKDSGESVLGIYLTRTGSGDSVLSYVRRRPHNTQCFFFEVPPLRAPFEPPRSA